MSKTLQNGSFQDAVGAVVNGGTIEFVLSHDAMIIAGGQVAPTRVSATLDSSGDMPSSFTILANDELTPSGTFYLTTVFDSNGARVFGPERWVFSGASPIDLDTLTPTIVDPAFANPILSNPVAAQAIADFNLSTPILNDVRVVDGTKFATIQEAIDDLSSTGGTVYVPIGTHTLTAELAMRSNVRVIGAGAKSIVTQGSAANLTNMINFLTNSANDASLENLTIDGNRANNTTGTSLVSLNVQTGNKVIHNFIKNAPGAGVLMTAGTGSVVFDNDFDAIFSNAVWIEPAATAITNAKVIGNRCTRWGGHFVALRRASGNTVALNIGEGTQIVSVVDTAATVVTWVSGDTFSTLLSGMFANVNGTETKITSVDSSTQLTVADSLGTQSSKAMIAGSGDGITTSSGNGNDITSNYIRQSMSNGFVVHNSIGTTSTTQTRLVGNHAEQNGDVGFWIVDDDGAGLVVDSTLLSSNMAAANGIGGHSLFDAGIKVSGAGVNNTAIHGNMFRDSQGSPTQLIAIAMDSGTGTGNRVGVNYVTGTMTALRSPLNANASGFSGPLSIHGGLIANEEGSDLDSRIEGDTDVNLFYVDAGNDRVGIGTAAPAATFDARGSVLVSTAEGDNSNVPRWIFKKVDFGDMTAGATADTFTLWTLPANTVIHDIMGVVNTGWSGGSISAAVASVGTNAGAANDLTLDDNFFTNAVIYELHDATASGGKGALLYDATDKFAPYMFIAGGIVELQMDLTGDNHVNATAGSARIYALVSQPLTNSTVEAS